MGQNDIGHLYFSANVKALEKSGHPLQGLAKFDYNPT